MSDIYNSLITFHQHKDFELFISIIESDDKMIKDNDMMDIWINTCLYSYGHGWADEFDDDLLESTLLQKNDIKMLRLINNLKKNINYTPKMSEIKKLWYIFFVTGDYDILAELYMCIGNPNAKSSIREESADLYHTYRDLYNVIYDHDDQSGHHNNPFKVLDDEINRKIKTYNDAKNDYENKIKPIVTKVDQTRDVEYLNKKISDTINEETLRSEKLDSLFDRISETI